MIRADLQHVRPFLSEEKEFKAREKAMESFRQVQSKRCQGAEWLGWRRILSDPDDALLDKIDTHARQIREQADLFIVCGIGGSYQGARGVIHALQQPFSSFENKGTGKGGTEVVFAGQHLGGQYLSSLLDYMSTPKHDGSRREVVLNVISKSGTTLETAIAFRMLRQWMEATYGDDARTRIIATTSPEGGVLNQIIDEKGYAKYVIPNDVGGRFSVLTPVGLLPVAVAGLDSKTLFYGAVGMYETLERDPGNLLDYAAARYCCHDAGLAVDLLSSFDPEWREMIGWLQQLLGESEGKEQKGLFPGVANYTTDLHSIGQMVQQGQRNLMETVIRTGRPLSSLSVEPFSRDGSKEEGHQGQYLDMDQLSYLEGKSMHDINESAINGTIQAHVAGGVPVVQILADALKEQQLGEFIYFYELFTAVYCLMLDVNPFNQPGVEDYKKAMYRHLGKPSQ